MDDYLGIKEARKILKTTAATLHRWEKFGKIKSYRHPMNNYRYYKIEDINKIINKINEE